MAKQVTTTKKPEPQKHSTTPPAVAKKTSTEVALSDDLTALMDQDSGRGVSTAAEDNIVPLIYILQSLSPQVLKQKAEYIKGAEAGNIWFRGTKDVVDGENDGLLVQPVYFSKCWIEWKPDRGGFVTRHPARPNSAEWVEDPKKPGVGKWELPNGNIVVETREHVVLVHRDGYELGGYVVAMSGSNHQASRAWMGLMKGKRIPGTDKRAPSFAFMYRMKTVPKTNDQGDWFAWQIEDAGDDGTPMIVSDVAAYKVARQLADDFESGTKRADTASDQVDDVVSRDNSADDDKI